MVQHRRYSTAAHLHGMKGHVHVHQSAEVFRDLARRHELQQALDRDHRIVLDEIGQLKRSQTAMVHQSSVRLQLGQYLLLLTGQKRSLQKTGTLHPNGSRNARGRFTICWVLKGEKGRKKLTTAASVPPSNPALQGQRMPYLCYAMLCYSQLFGLCTCVPNLD